MNEINQLPPLIDPPTDAVGEITPQQVKALERRNGMVAGVAGGLADYFDVDPTVVRLALVGLTILSGGPFLPLAYLVAWILIPEASPVGDQPEVADTSGGDR